MVGDEEWAPILQVWPEDGPKDAEESTTATRQWAEDVFKEYWWYYFLSWVYQAPIVTASRAALFDKHWALMDKVRLIGEVLEELEQDGFMTTQDRLAVLRGELKPERLRARLRAEALRVMLRSTQKGFRIT